MAWTKDQLLTLYANIYSGSEECPTCGSLLDVKRSLEVNAFGIVRCSACGNEHFVSASNDPLRSTFREYTPAEQGVIVEENQAMGNAVCPVDRSRMKTVETATIGADTLIIVQCKRCGRSAQYRRAR